MEEQELNRKLARWAGFAPKETINLSGGKYQEWLHPNGLQTNWIPDFTTSLDACFKQLVPKAIERSRFIYPCGLDEAEKRLFGRWLAERQENHQITWVVALCLAIEKLIDEVNNA